MGANKEFYGVGFSLGANHLTRYLGAANQETNMFKAGVSVSNPFDILASSIAIRDSSLGIVDYVMRVSLIK
jgi:predicted alpha/beta-fold hydrolase